MEYEIKHSGKFKYVEEGKGEPLVLLHGLFGALSNFKDLVQRAENGIRFRALMREIDTSILAGDFGQLHNLIR